VALGLDDFTTHTEATHWSGSIHGSDTALLEEYKVPMFDIEIGSLPETLANPVAAEAIARTLVEVFKSDVRPKTVLALGGIHFDDTYSKALRDDDSGVSVAHFLPTVWLVNGGYEGEAGVAKLTHAMEQIAGGIDAVIYNDNMKKPVKDCVRAFAEKSGKQLLKHRRLHNPTEIEWK
jgi:D-tyrosyl-tRNA(Tyr) deacylase